MRLHNWQVKFAAFVASRVNTPFTWGTNDCAIFACDSTLAITGVDHGKDLRAHRTAKEALNTLEERGGVSGIADAALGARIPVLMANIGDVMLIEESGREALAVCNGGSILAVAHEGLTSLPMSRGLTAWRVA